ncbi:MAG TPA: ankyrin repeat domain-containing protein [Candidatus Saccharimonadales bacterium]|nr:ankyrin repeat domain-containing protein [Candidatus Saccharimonadales bacterium]
MNFDEAVRGLMAGDYSRLAPLFKPPAEGSSCQITRWYDEGLFEKEPKALAEAFSCACFNGFTQVVEYFLSKGLGPDGGMNTGLNAFHWAANRGNLDVVEVLIRNNASLEIQNAYGGTVLGCAVWSAVHESKPRHVQIVEALLKAGAKVSAAEYPSGDDQIDEVLRRHGAKNESAA